MTKTLSFLMLIAVLIFGSFTTLHGMAYWPAPLPAGGPQHFTVSVNSQGTGALGGGSFFSGDTVPINAGTAPVGYTFSGWQASVSVHFQNPNSLNTSFIMPDLSHFGVNYITLTANFTGHIPLK